MRYFAPSILSADFAHLAREMERVGRAGAAWIHVDVMDGHFVPNLTIGAPVVKSLRKATDLFLDVHLMITSPDRFLDDFLKAGADGITVHFESEGDTAAQLRRIRAAGKKAAVAIKPATPMEEIVPLLPLLDMALVMTVEPGFGGQGLIPHCLEKARALRRVVDEMGLSTLIQIDGGASLQNAAEIAKAGVDVMVAGSAVFAAPDPEEAVREFLRRSGAAAQVPNPG